MATDAALVPARRAGEGKVQPRPAQPIIAIPPNGSADARSLKFDLSTDRLVCDLQRATSDGAPRDWSNFGALLLRILGPPEGAEAMLLLRSGGPAGFGEATFRLRLAAGWNLITVDLDAISRGRERHDMRELEIVPSVSGAKPPFYLDDIVLADRTQWFAGQNGGPGELYAYARGPRVFVGVPDRFELVFAEGVISAWYATGPENLAGRGGLGPWPAFIGSDWSGRLEDSSRKLIVASPSEYGFRPAVSQKVLESSAARVVLEGSHELRLGDTAAENADATELRRCAARYVIYRDGHVFVQTDLDAGPSAWPLGRAGDALFLNSGTNFSVSDRPPATPEHDPANFALLTHTSSGADLLWAPHLASSMRWRRFFSETGRQPSLLIAGETPAAPVMSSAQLLWFCPASLDAPAAEEIASDYQEPLALRPDAGTLVTDAPGDLNHDGYNESEGCYELALQRGRLRFGFDPGSLPRQAPLFRIHGGENTRCWVYADGEALPAEARDASGRILFTLPGVIRSPRMIEIYALSESP
jgi:hypothetical protein